MSLDTIIDDVLDASKRFGADKEPGAQLTVEWLYQRVGKCTGSQFSEVMAKRKDKKEAAPRYNYKMELVVERLTQIPAERWVSKYMIWGTEQEAAARQAYEAATGAFVTQPGFKDHPTIPMCGGSVDGLVDDDGIIEIKAPTTFNHIETILGGMPEEHEAQTQGYLWITGRKWADFISYDPRLPEHLQLFIERRERNDEYIAQLEAEIILFQGEVDAIYNKLAKRESA